MKTLTHHTLIYDEDCPLCRAYSTAFVKTQMLDADGKLPYSQLRDCSFIDRERAANEIALVNVKDKTTVYGIDSLLAIIGNSFPIAEKIGKLKLVNLALTKLYRLISYNRKVIMPNPKSASKRTQCVPEFNVRYRLIYILFAVLATTTVLHLYTKLLPQLRISGFMPELLLAFGQAVFQSLFIVNKGWRTVLDYVGHLLTVSLFGGLLLLPMLVADIFWPIGEFASVRYFALVATIMFIEHFRRTELLGLPKILCASWILYRIIFLIIAF